MVVVTPPSGSTFALGETTVNVTATDFEGNVSTASFTVTVVDTTAPVITVPDPIIAEATGATGAVVDFVVTAADIVDPAPVVVVTPPSGSTFALGETTVNVTATDFTGNVSSSSFTVTVEDTSPPVITMPDPIIAQATGVTGAVVNFVVNAADLVDPEPVVVVTPPSGSLFPIGQTIVTCTATDDAGNESTSSFTVTVTGEPDIFVRETDGDEIADGTGEVIFAPTDIGSPGTVKSFTIRNDGTTNLVLGAITIDGATGDFSINGPAIFELGPEDTTTFTVTFVPTELGNRSAILHIPSNDPDALETSYDIILTGTGTAPEIAVEQPVGTDLNVGETIEFSANVVGSSSAAAVFKIKNTGDGLLTLTAPATIGGNAGSFIVDTAGTLLSIPGGQETTFAVTFTPTEGGDLTTTLRIANNDANENPFDITLTGTAYSFTIDTDLDGLNDATEFQMAALGFDPAVNQTELVNTLFGNLGGAQSNLNAVGYFTTSQVQTLHVDTPLIQRNPSTGIFTLTLGLEKSTTLQPGDFAPFPFTTPGTTINGDGKIEFQFTSPENAAFFRLEAE